LVEWRAGGGSSTGDGFAAARGCSGRVAGSGGLWCEVDGEDGELAVGVGAGRAILLGAEADEAVRSRERGGSEELVPVRGRDGQRGDHDGPDPIRAGFGDEAVEEGGRREGEEDLAVGEAARGAWGLVPVADGEGVLGFCRGLRIASEEAWQKAVGLGREGVDGEAPAVAFGELASPFAKKGAADWAGHFDGTVAGKVVDALVDED
jgi:hypothetical protein